MADNSIASGAVILKANADQLAGGLAQAGRKVESWGQSVGRKLNDATMKGMSGQFSGALAGGLVGGSLSQIAKGIGDSIADAVVGIGRFKAELAATESMLGRIEKSMAANARAADEWRSAMDAAGQVASINAELADLRATGEALLADWKTAADRAAAVGERSFGGFGRFLLGRNQETIELAKKRADELAKSIGKIGERMKELDQRKLRILDPNQDPKVIGDFNKALEKARDAVATTGMSPIEKTIHGFEKLGLAKDKLDELRGALELAAEAERRFAERQESLAKMAGNPWLSMALSAAGAIAGAFEKVGDMGPKFAGAIERGSLEAYQLSIRNRFGDMGRGKDGTAAAVKDGNKLLGKAVDELRGVNKAIANIEEV